jgi:formamidopyrimidine-DNA glycosylase
MPELPEVETIVRDLSKSLRCKIFSDVIVHDAFLLRQNQNDFIRRIKNQAIERITRRGKAVIVHLASGEFLVIQLMMTGQLIAGGKNDKHTRITFNFSDGSKLLYNDQRRFGQIRLVESLSQIQHFNILGPEPFSEEFNPAYMRVAFQKTIRPIKNVLLDHTFVAGIGNIYACEVLYQSRLSPKRQARRITLPEIKTIHGTIIEVLNEAIAHRGSSIRNYRDGAGQKGRFNERLSVYARQGLPCPRCQKSILRISQAGRGTFYCKQCQK